MALAHCAGAKTAATGWAPGSHGCEAEQPLPLVLSRAGCPQPPETHRLCRAGTPIELRILRPGAPRMFCELSVSETQTERGVHDIATSPK